jgi:hypothetical protein
VFDQPGPWRPHLLAPTNHTLRVVEDLFGATFQPPTPDHRGIDPLGRTFGHTPKRIAVVVDADFADLHGPLVHAWLARHDVEPLVVRSSSREPAADVERIDDALLELLRDDAHPEALTAMAIGPDQLAQAVAIAATHSSRPVNRIVIPTGLDHALRLALAFRPSPSPPPLPTLALLDSATLGAAL